MIQDIIWAGNELIGLPYIYGGGHGSFISPGYDCSGTVSFALHGGDLLSIPEDSSEFEAWGSHGAGRWVAIFANPGHAYMTVAGLRLDTSPAEDPVQPRGAALAPAAPDQRRFHRSSPARALTRNSLVAGGSRSATLDGVGRVQVGRLVERQ